MENKEILIKIMQALKEINFGSIEIYIQESKVTQITKRKIEKIK